MCTVYTRWLKIPKDDPRIFNFGPFLQTVVIGSYACHLESRSIHYFQRTHVSGCAKSSDKNPPDAMFLCFPAPPNPISGFKYSMVSIQNKSLVGGLAHGFYFSIIYGMSSQPHFFGHQPSFFRGVNHQPEYRNIFHQIIHW